MSRIAAFSVFADLPAPELNELAGVVSEVDVEAGAKVITLDDSEPLSTSSNRERPTS